MNESWVTLQGWVGGEVSSREANGTPVATFRLGCTPRYLKNGAWVDGQTSWFTVTAWRTLAQHVAASVHKGDAVAVHGKLRADVWEREGEKASITHIVDATFVGHDLNRGTSTFAKAAPRERTESPADSAVRELVHGLSDDGPQLDSEGGEPRQAPAA